MFEASVDGQPYDTERWGQYFRPAGVQAPSGSSDAETAAPATANFGQMTTAAPAAKAAPAPVAETPAWEDEEPAAATAPVAKPAATTQKAEDILAMIRSRQQK